MAIVQGIQEKVHLPIYDCLKVEPGKQLREAESSSTLRFFVNVQDKTKLLTNLQSASLLPAYNSFEARAMRVIISDLPPEFPDPEDKNAPRTKGEDAEGFDVTDEDGSAIDTAGQIEGAPDTTFVPTKAVTADLDLDLKRVMELLREARESVDKETTIGTDEDGVTLLQGETELTDIETTNVEGAGGEIALTIPDLEALAQSMDKKSPPLEQIRLNDGAGTVTGQAYLQHRHDIHCRGEGDDPNADLLVSRRRGRVFARGQKHVARRTVAASDVSLCRADIYR